MEILSELGVRAALINPRFIKPLDADLICTWAQKTGRLITIEDNSGQGGFGSAVLELLSSKEIYSVKTRRLAHPDSFIEHGPQDVLLANSKLDVESIVNAAQEILK